ncbi:MAG: hypothetical protein ACRDQA_01595, partial [Nocardioidaceae bacterium]
STADQGREHAHMLFIVIALVVVVALAALVTAFVAYPNRGEPIPHAAWLSDAMTRARDRIVE